jgi:hypothetical protein
MKRNRETVKVGRLSKANGASSYAKKVATGKQMYGGTGSASCCAHRIGEQQIAAARARARVSAAESNTARYYANYAADVMPPSSF